MSAESKFIDLNTGHSEEVDFETSAFGYHFGFDAALNSKQSIGLRLTKINDKVVKLSHEGVTKHSVYQTDGRVGITYSHTFY